MSVRLPRFRQPFPRKDRVREAEGSRQNSRPLRSPVSGERSDHGPKHGADVRAGGKPAQRSRPIFGWDGVADVGLKDYSRSAAQALHDAAKKQQPDRISEHDKQKRSRRRSANKRADQT